MLLRHPKRHGTRKGHVITKKDQAAPSPVTAPPNSAAAARSRLGIATGCGHDGTATATGSASAAWPKLG
eukprot:5507782-Prymnesium_polylepis.1